MVAQSPRQYSPVETWWLLSGIKGVNGGWGAERQCQEQRGPWVMVCSVLGMKTEPWGSWMQAGAKPEVRKGLGQS